MAQPRIFYEDFAVGESLELGRRVVDRDEVVAFARSYDPQPFHVDEEAARASFFGGLIASGWHTCAMVMRMMCDSYLLDSASLGSPGLENIRWLEPVRPGDEIRAVRIVTGKRVSKSRPEVGIVSSRWEVFNQRGAMVMSMDGSGMFRLRHPVAAS